MAYALRPEDEEQQQGLPQALTSESSTIEGAQPSGLPAAQAPSKPTDKGGSQFPDVSRYLNQNQAQANRLASQIGSNVVKTGEEARQRVGAEQQKVQGAQSAFNTAANASHVQYDPNIVNRAAANPTSFFQPQARDPGRGGWVDGAPQQLYPTKDYVKSAGTRSEKTITGPTNSTLTPNTTPLTPTNQSDFDAFEAQRNAQYGGPTDLGYNVNYNPLESLVGKATDVTGNAKTDTGRLSLLRDLYGNGVSSPGASNFDNLLLRSSGAQNVLGRAGAQNAGLENILGGLRSAEGQAQSGAAQRGQSEVANAEGIRGKVNEAFYGPSGSYTNFTKDYGDRLAKAQEDAKKIQRQYFLGNSAQTEASKKSADELNNITNVASEQDYDKLAALNQLLGSNYEL